MICGIRGHSEATTASEATKMAVRSNTHSDTRVNEIADFKSEVKFDFLRSAKPFDNLRGLQMMVGAINKLK